MKSIRTAVSALTRRLNPAHLGKVFSQQLKELVEAGLIRRISYDTVPPKVEYVLTPSGEQLILPWTYSISGVSARCTTAESPSMRMPL